VQYITISDCFSHKPCQSCQIIIGRSHFISPFICALSISVTDAPVMVAVAATNTSIGCATRWCRSPRSRCASERSARSSGTLRWSGWLGKAWCHRNNSGGIFSRLIHFAPHAIFVCARISYDIFTTNMVQGKETEGNIVSPLCVMPISLSSLVTITPLPSPPLQHARFVARRSDLVLRVLDAR
jgi:hypothetical protein